MTGVEELLELYNRIEKAKLEAINLRIAIKVHKALTTEGSQRREPTKYDLELWEKIDG